MRGDKRVLIASTNRGKLREFQALLDADAMGVLSASELVLLSDVLPAYEAPEETGATFLENARIKAWAAARASGLVTIADDSGLEVDALGGAPGVYSARYAGEDAGDAANRSKLKAALSHVPDAQRTARFRCALVMADPAAGEELAAEGVCEGRIAREERGTGGFGYDPLFLVFREDGSYPQTMAELPAETKNRVSHRGRAMAALIDRIRARG